jgi:hypothetical protein
VSVRRIAAVLLIVTAGLFVVGVAIEKSDGHAETKSGSAGHDEGAEAGGEPTTTHTEGGKETVIGVDIEAPVVVALAVAVSLAVAAALWLTALMWIAIAAGVVALGFAVFDVAEVLHQLDESRTGLAVLAAVVASGHAAATAISARVAARP